MTNWISTKYSKPAKEVEVLFQLPDGKVCYGVIATSKPQDTKGRPQFYDRVNNKYRKHVVYFAYLPQPIKSWE